VRVVAQSFKHPRQNHRRRFSKASGYYNDIRPFFEGKPLLVRESLPAQRGAITPQQTFTVGRHPSSSYSEKLLLKIYIELRG
jgi:hypothetical protein